MSYGSDPPDDFDITPFLSDSPFSNLHEDYNLNQNKFAKDRTEYWGKWEDDFYPSPESWRMPFYTVDVFSNQLRAGGDVQGLIDTLDYLEGMGIKGIYLAGSPFINQPWSADSYSPLDLTLLGFHFGNITIWQHAIDEMHKRGIMGDLVGFEGYLNEGAPFSFKEHKHVWKSVRRYWDFKLSEKVVDCTPPRFWTDKGYGDVASFGNCPEWQKKISKFSSAQDRLREWSPSVIDKIKLFSCIAVNMLDIDGFRIDKALTITLDAQADWPDYMRECAKKLAKTTSSFLVKLSQDMVLTNNMVNINTGKFDPRHLYGTTNQDVFRWPAITNGTQKNMVGQFVTTLGEEQAMKVLENAASNYLFGRQPMSSTLAWQLHGCYRAGVEKYYNFPSDDALWACEDQNVSLDHRDPSHLSRLIIKRIYELRAAFPVLNDGFGLIQLPNHTFNITLPGSGGTVTQTGLWSVACYRRSHIQDFAGQGAGNLMVWLLYGNENKTTTYNFNCSDSKAALIATFEVGTTVQNLFYPYEECSLTASSINFPLDGNFTGSNGCLVPKSKFVEAAPVITKLSPGHDLRLLSDGRADDEIHIELEFSTEMDCKSVTDAISIESNTSDGTPPVLDKSSVNCTTMPALTEMDFTAKVASGWKFAGSLTKVSNGVHRVTIRNPSTKAGNATTGSTDHLLFRTCKFDNPMVFPFVANYSSEMVPQAPNGDLYVQHPARGASKFRCSRTWGSSWTDWMDYTGANYTMPKKMWNGTDQQAWHGEHVTCQYWSKLAGSSHHQQEGDLNKGNLQQRFPHVFVHGKFNEFGIDQGLPSAMTRHNHSKEWTFDLMAEMPTTFRMIVLHETVYKYSLVPIGSQYSQVVMFVLLWLLPTLFGMICVWVFMRIFYGVKFNKPNVWEMDAGSPDRRTVLITTMEYDIEDWGIKIKIGSLGVMAQLMGKKLGHQDLIWVVPCVGGVDYPVDQPGEPMHITIMDKEYKVDVQYHVLRNITYVVLDAPVFRQQTKNEPYPPRMDDMDSAVYYSAWNQCIAQAIKRFPVDIYHSNNYHGALAPLHLLPDVIPCCLSLHNAEFQGLWPMRTDQERTELCKVFNIDESIAKEYAQFGKVFNLLHAGASYLRLHQKGFGAVGVSRKYGTRSYARYPIFWGLSKINALPNPDPTDTAEWKKGEKRERGELRMQAQKWAGLNEDPTAELFVFVGRWLMQKGVDLIADVCPSILKNNDKAQLIYIGSVIDFYGKFAALKLEKIMQLYPGRVFSKPEFTALLPYIFSGAEFALIPSRDELFGLVAVEFGWKGALGVRSRIGGLGQSQFLLLFLVINEALGSKPETRALMRAQSAKQRFPVAAWVENLEILQSTSIKKSMQVLTKPPSLAPRMTKSPRLRPESVGSPQLNIKWPVPPSALSPELMTPTTPLPSPGIPSPGMSNPSSINSSPTTRPSSPNSYLSPRLPSLPDDSASSFYGAGSNLSHRSSLLSLKSVVGQRKDFALQQVDPFFNDTSGHYYREFENRLEGLGPKNPEDTLCIVLYINKSEKKWAADYHNAKLSHSDSSSDLRKNLRKANYQITLLAGEIGQKANVPYTIASVYAVTSILWWFLFRMCKSVYILSPPFAFYGLAFLMLAVAPLASSMAGRGAAQHAASAFYAVASSGGKFYFALNIGGEGGSPIKEWLLRAAIVQGIQQIYVSSLWYWGTALTKMSSSEIGLHAGTSPGELIGCICLALGMWAIGGLIYAGLPPYYRQSPGSIPSFYTSIVRRRVVLRFLVMVLVQNYWLCAPYGRNWSFLWTSQHTTS
ncbi:hypothetical protein EJ06DRAFT_520290 [Trichodelitschia bisporula]|uniref:alpha-1,3-glucan synthase n=1 Tax=Trichodelitschia bisporula TaxID=703511 RepID=A0A6G1I2F2_9PEZI|nr:hypothetical protein EJ06DRAFT_520290 [Trichodelitschia bisporula]